MIIAVFRPVPASLWVWVTAGMVGVDGKGSGVFKGSVVEVRLGSGEGVSDRVDSKAAASVSLAQPVLVAPDTAVAVI